VAARARDRQAQARRMMSRLTISARELRDFTTAVQEGPINTLSDPEFNRVVKSLGATVTELRNSFARAADRAAAARAEAEPALRRLVARTDTISKAISQLQLAAVVCSLVP
jgi:hypothetical protein